LLDRIRLAATLVDERPEALLELPDGSWRIVETITVSVHGVVTIESGRVRYAVLDRDRPDRMRAETEERELVLPER
jgi:hypothetical protein